MQVYEGRYKVLEREVARSSFFVGMVYDVDVD